jgi:uncharacterized protein (DUF2252 family)
MNIVEATAAYEAWAAERITLVPEDLEQKHHAMSSQPFLFMRATFYRWMQQWPAVCSELARAPKLLAVGDLHIENFGTWRDAEGRLVWGVNDFDEAYPLPYTIDLVRLATSALLAASDGALALTPQGSCRALLEGYGKGLAAGGRPFVLEETHGWMRDMALNSLREPEPFWAKMARLPTYEGSPPKKVRKLFEQHVPSPAVDYRVAHRAAGLGSLGRQRFVALAGWHGGMIAREAKASLPSACGWAARTSDRHGSFYSAIVDGAIRCPDPCLHPSGKWILRRLAADCSRIDLGHLPRKRAEERLFRAMGWETANIHLGSPDRIRAVRHDLDRRPAGWLGKAAKAMARAVTADWREWHRHHTALHRGDD